MTGRQPETESRIDGGIIRRDVTAAHAREVREIIREQGRDLRAAEIFERLVGRFEAGKVDPVIRGVGAAVAAETQLVAARDLVRIVEGLSELLCLLVEVLVGERSEVPRVPIDPVEIVPKDASFDEAGRCKLALEIDLLDDRVEGLRVELIGVLQLGGLTRDQREVVALQERKVAGGERRREARAARIERIARDLDVAVVGGVWRELWRGEIVEIERLGADIG